MVLCGQMLDCARNRLKLSPKVSVLHLLVVIQQLWGAE